jgi:alpha-amylase/alpha-mannosidase (GH57 family)
VESEKMVKPTVNIAFVLHMHQPIYNLHGSVLNSEVAKNVFDQTMHPYTFPLEVLEKHENVKVTFNFTGSLIEQLSDLANAKYDSRLNGIWQRYRDLKRKGKVEFTGCGYFHPIFPLIKDDDARKQIEAHLEIYERTFGEKPVGFWPPELAFSENMIPLLDNIGFKWVIVDEPHVSSIDGKQKWYELLYRPHFVEHDEHRLTAVVRDRELSIAQQSGYDPIWLMNQIQLKLQRIKQNEEDLLFIIATDGENGWFRHSGEKAGFWGWFFEPLIEKLNSDANFSFIKLTTISEYLSDHPPKEVVKVSAGSWNVPDVPDDGRFLKWTQGKLRKEYWDEIDRTRNRIKNFEETTSKLGSSIPFNVKRGLEEAWRWLLLAEGSDNFYWGNSEWLERVRFCCKQASQKIDEISKIVMPP